jgi:hypothetical protein
VKLSGSGLRIIIFGPTHPPPYRYRVYSSHTPGASEARNRTEAIAQNSEATPCTPHTAELLLPNPCPVASRMVSESLGRPSAAENTGQISGPPFGGLLFDSAKGYLTYPGKGGMLINIPLLGGVYIDLLG